MPPAIYLFIEEPPHNTHRNTQHHQVTHWERWVAHDDKVNLWRRQIEKIWRYHRKTGDELLRTLKWAHKKWLSVRETEKQGVWWRNLRCALCSSLWSDHLALPQDLKTFGICIMHNMYRVTNTTLFLTSGHLCLHVKNIKHLFKMSLSVKYNFCSQKFSQCQITCRKLFSKNHNVPYC